MAFHILQLNITIMQDPNPFHKDNDINFSSLTTLFSLALCHFFFSMLMSVFLEEAG